jgi:hypothetical protein
MSEFQVLRLNGEGWRAIAFLFKVIVQLANNQK